jgi:hypothetical protein
VHYAGISVRGRTLSETDVAVKDFEDHIVSWPNEDPALRIGAADPEPDDDPN